MTILKDMKQPGLARVILNFDLFLMHPCLTLHHYSADKKSIGTFLIRKANDWIYSENVFRTGDGTA